jgi:hypothetical protein
VFFAAGESAGSRKKRGSIGVATNISAVRVTYPLDRLGLVASSVDFEGAPDWGQESNQVLGVVFGAETTLNS